MNQDILYTLAGVASALAGFSGLVIVFRQRGVRDWSATELRYLWFLIGDSFLVVFLALLPVLLLIAGLSDAVIWSLCNGILGVWFIVADVIAIRGEIRDRRERKQTVVPVVTPILYALTIVAALTAVALLLSAFGLFVPPGQAIYIFALMILLAFGALEFMFFVGSASIGSNEREPG